MNALFGPSPAQVEALIAELGKRIDYPYVEIPKIREEIEILREEIASLRAMIADKETNES